MADIDKNNLNNDKSDDSVVGGVPDAADDMGLDEVMGSGAAGDAVSDGGGDALEGDVVEKTQEPKIVKKG